MAMTQSPSSYGFNHWKLHGGKIEQDPKGSMAIGHLGRECAWLGLLVPSGPVLSIGPSRSVGSLERCLEILELPFVMFTPRLDQLTKWDGTVGKQEWADTTIITCSCIIHRHASGSLGCCAYILMTWLQGVRTTRQSPQTGQWACQCEIARAREAFVLLGVCGGDRF